jgi:threonine dehydrogenase-like Zn-dependent dehydrogenase
VSTTVGETEFTFIPRPPHSDAKTFVLYSVFKEDITVDWSIISDDKELDLLGAHLGPHCWPAAIAMIESGKLPLDKICTHQLPLADFQKGLDMVSAGNESIKVSLIP